MNNDYFSEPKKLINELFKNQFYTLEELKLLRQEYLRCFKKDGKIMPSRSQKLNLEDVDGIKKYVQERSEKFLSSCKPEPKDPAEKQNYRNQWRICNELKQLQEEIEPVLHYVLAPIFYDEEVFLAIATGVRISRVTNDVVCFNFSQSSKEIEAVKFCGKQEHLGYDAVFRFADGSEQKVEVTIAGIGHQQALENEVLRGKGIVWLNQELKVEGPKSARTKLEYANTTPVAKELSGMSALWIEGFQKKNKDRKYGGCWLIVGYDFLMPPELEDLVGEIDNFLSFLKNLGEKNIFEKIIFVRMKTTIIDEKITETPISEKI
jgi:hypothetical protein